MDNTTEPRREFTGDDVLDAYLAGKAAGAASKHKNQDTEHPTIKKTEEQA
ncbi:MAG: hypothetical protein SOI13_01465 [Bifidobacterium mongoliense]|jgi:hypothetical protein